MTPPTRPPSDDVPGSPGGIVDPTTGSTLGAKRVRPPRDSGPFPEEGPLAEFLAGMPRLAPPVDLRARVFAAFDAAERGEHSRAPERGRLLWLRPAWIGAAAAAAAVLAVGWPMAGSSAAGPGRAASHPTRWVTVAAPPTQASAPFRFVDDPSLPLQLVAAGPLDGP